MFMTVLQVALGGAIGAVLRFLAGVGILRLVGPGFPMAVMTVNILGSFAIGMFVVYAGATRYGIFDTFGHDGPAGWVHNFLCLLFGGGDFV
jgi:fluoride ion exporter CrcB/FEX